jgi:hypothetical protein
MVCVCTQLEGCIVDRDPSEQRESPEPSLESLAPTPEFQDQSSESANPLLETPKPAPEPQSPSPPPAEPSLPESYGETSLVAVPVNPFEVHCQWEVAPADIENARQALGVAHQEFWPVLRIQDVGGAAASFDVEVDLEARNWYVRSCTPDQTYRADFALKSEDGSFVVVASSNPAHTPPATPSTQADESWAPIRLDPRPPLDPVPPMPPAGLQNEPLFFFERDMAKPPGSLPIDMREDVRSTYVALYGDQERKEPELLLPNQFSVPLDLKTEVPSELAGLYREQESGESKRVRVVGADATLASAGLAFESVLHKGSVSDTPVNPAAMTSEELFDLTSLNERSFSPGASSGTK